MAKCNKGNRTVECDILNESGDKYVVRFGSGAIQLVEKENVHSLNDIDEGVLDRLKDITKNAHKYGRKVVSKVKDAAKAIKEFFLRAFRIGDYVFFKNPEGIVVPAVHPVNTMAASKDHECVNFVASDVTIEFCREMGITPVAVENFEFGGEYDGAIQFDDITVDELSESLKDNKGSLIKALYEADNRLTGKEKISLKGTFCDWTQNEIVDYIGNEYMSRYNGKKPNSLPLLIWGAPGIGKTTIMRNIQEAIGAQTGTKPNIISINGGNVGPDDFTMPASITKTLNSDDIDDADAEGFKGATKTYIKDLPKEWLPVYNPNSDEANPEDLNKIANGGKYNEETGEYENGPGGIFFIDEYSRMTQAGMDALMQTPTTREIGSNSTLKFGDRWVIVCAANRKSDMSRRGGSEALSFEGAAKTRFNHCNFVPDPKDWLAWAKTQSKRRPGRSNVLLDIVSYVESELKRDPNEFGDFYEMWTHPNGDLDGTKGTASPRTWEALSETLIDQKLDNDFGKKYPSISSMPKAELKKLAAGIVGGDVADRFAEFVAQFSIFTPKDAENVWTKGDNAKYEILKQQKLNSANIEEYFTKHIFPLLKDCYPGGFEAGKVSPEAAVNFLQFLESACYDGGTFNLNRFKTISTQFGMDFGVDLRSVNGPYADAANYKEQVVAKNELV